MLSRRWQELAATLEELRIGLQRMEHRTELMQTVLMVREPSSAAAGEAYDGLRKQVVNAVSERHAHLSHLVQVDHAVRTGAPTGDLSALTDAWFEEAGLLRVTDPEDPRADLLFELVQDCGGLVEVLAPAYVDAVSGRIIRRGRARRVPVAIVPARETPPPDVPPTEAPPPAAVSQGTTEEPA